MDPDDAVGLREGHPCRETREGAEGVGGGRGGGVLCLRLDTSHRGGGKTRKGVVAFGLVSSIKCRERQNANMSPRKIDKSFPDGPTSLATDTKSRPKSQMKWGRNALCLQFPRDQLVCHTQTATTGKHIASKTHTHTNTLERQSHKEHPFGCALGGLPPGQSGRPTSGRSGAPAPAPRAELFAISQSTMPPPPCDGKECGLDGMGTLWSSCCQPN